MTSSNLDTISTEEAILTIGESLYIVNLNVWLCYEKNFTICKKQKNKKKKKKNILKKSLKHQR